MPRTALIVVVGEAEPAVGALRLEHDWSAPLGVPAHVTVLYPFAGPDDVDEAALAETFAALPAFDFALDRVERFDAGPVWLHPEPSEHFAALTHAVWQRFPDYPPYEGVFEVVIPHLTVSDVPLEVSVPLPILSRADAVTWIEETPDGRWATRRVFPLQGVA
jgi:hypothetical protein